MKKAAVVPRPSLQKALISGGLFLAMTGLGALRVAGWPALLRSAAAMASRCAFPSFARSLLPIPVWRLLSASGVGHYIICKPTPAAGFFCLARLVNAAKFSTAFV